MLYNWYRTPNSFQKIFYVRNRNDDIFLSIKSIYKITYVSLSSCKIGFANYVSDEQHKIPQFIIRSCFIYFLFKFHLYNWNTDKLWLIAKHNYKIKFWRGCFLFAILAINREWINLFSREDVWLHISSKTYFQIVLINFSFCCL